MTRAKWLLAVVLLVAVAADGTAKLDEDDDDDDGKRIQIIGTITDTLTIDEDAVMVGDVTCEV